jgi:hypothetical protein
MIDLDKEIQWHKEHLCNLKIQARNPQLFHSMRTSGPIEEHHQKHFQEQVIDAIPFHEKLLAEHEERSKIISSIIPAKSYKKIQDICLDTKTVGDYLVFDKQSQKFFFANESLTPEKQSWSKKVSKHCDVITIHQTCHTTP